MASSKDSIEPEHVAAFERAASLAHHEVVECFMTERLPNRYLETFIARMLVMRAAAADDDLFNVLDRVLRTASAESAENTELYEEVREKSRQWKAERKERMQ